MRFNPIAFPPMSSPPDPHPWQDSVPAYAADCETRARELLQRNNLAEDDRARLETVLHTVEARYNADYLLFLPVDSWSLITSAAADLMVIEAKYGVA